MFVKPFSTFRYPNELLIFAAPPGYGAAPYMAAPYGAMPPPPQYGAPPAWGKLSVFIDAFQRVQLLQARLRHRGQVHHTDARLCTVPAIDLSQ